MGYILSKYVLLFLIYLGYNSADYLNDSNTLIDDLLAKHQKYTLPVRNKNDTLNVTIQMFFISIKELDEVQEIFSYSAGLNLVWQDIGMMWDPSQYGGVDEVDISLEELWIPDIELSNPAKEAESVGQNWQRVNYRFSGHASWRPGVLFETKCPINSRNFPFDTQICTTILTTVGSPGKISFNAVPEVDILDFQGSSTWSLLKTSVNINYIRINGAPIVDFTFHLKRKPGFVIINIILPISFLSLLNVLVFVLTPDSGERVSFCITVLLSIAVFMTIVSDTLPETSEPVPIISYKLLVDMILSSLVTVVTILNLGIYNKPENELKSRWFLRIYSIMYCKQKCTCNQVCPIQSDDVVSIIDDDKFLSADKRASITDPEDAHMSKNKHDKLMKPESKVCTCDLQVTWKDISRMIDRVSFIFFGLASVTGFAIFILNTATA